MKRFSIYAKVVATVTVIFSGIHGLPAADYIYEVKTDMKVIHPEKTGLPGTTTVLELLNMIPELTGRNGDALFPNYDITYDGKSVGESRDIILSQTLIYTLSAIEISSSPTVAQQKNGEGGIINLVPAPLPEGFGGEVSALASTEVDFMPAVKLNFKNRKVEVRSTVDMEYYSPSNVKVARESENGRIINVTDSSRNGYCQQTARVNLKYNISDNDVLKGWLVESYSADRDLSRITRITSLDKSRQMGEPGWLLNDTLRRIESSKSRTLMVNAMGKYEHRFGDIGKLTMSANYQISDNRADDGVNAPHTFNGEAKIEWALVNRKDNVLKIKPGLNTTFTAVDVDTDRHSNLYLSPFVELNWKFRRLGIKAGARYQYFKRDLTGSPGRTKTGNEHDLTANLNATFQMLPHHSLRLIIARNLMRPSDDMLFADSSARHSGLPVQGNPALERAYIHHVDLDYIHDWQEGPHNVIVNADIGYNRADGLIEKRMFSDSSDDKPYYSYMNSGINDILKGGLSLLYTYRKMTLTLGCNVFCNWMQKEGRRDIHAFANLNSSLLFRFDRGWTLKGSLRYNSPVVREQSVDGDCITVDLSVNKIFGNWCIYAFLNDVFDYISSDVDYTGGREIHTQYDLYARALGIGVNYKFGNLKNTRR